MLYRFKSTFHPEKKNKYTERLYSLKEVGPKTKNMNWDYTRFGGAWMAGGMPMGDLDAPQIQNSKARFWFTNEGFHKYGPAIIEAAKAEGLPLQVIKIKEPNKSREVYRDKWQVALLPDR